MLVVALALGVAACRSAPEGEGGRLERITLAPKAARRPVGEAQRFTATGHYAGGATRNFTQRVDYTSSDPAIARAANAAGTVTISVRDPKTGMRSDPTDGNATLTVLGALERITLAPVAIKRVVGQMQRLTATGHYAGGTTRNLTQHVEYRSSDPAVATVPNAAGDKSRVEIVGTGTATISATDPKTGVSTAGAGDATVTVLAKP
jgi:trimeric autotransporter adhesin